MRVVRHAVLLAVAAALVAAAGSASAATGAPTGLHAFLLRADEPQRTSFSRTPSFAWNPVPGAVSYDFQLSLSTTFRDNSVIWADPNAKTPVEAPPITLPWITGNPHSLYARVRAVTPDGATAWSDSFGFDVVPPPPPTPLPSYPGVLRWTPVEGAAGYEVWLVDTKKQPELVMTNVLDEREFYTFHQSASWTGTIRWRIRALRADTSPTGSPVVRANQIPVVQHGAWSPVYVSSNPPFTSGPIKLIGTVSDVFSDGSPTSRAHRLMPAFLWSGNQTADGTTAELYRVYVFTDKQCLNPVFQSAVVGGPAYAPRAKGTLALPTTTAGIAGARSTYLQDGAEPASVMYDGSRLPAPNEASAAAAPTLTPPGSPGDSATSAAAGGGGAVALKTFLGAPTDLWDTEWPSSGYYWTVVPVGALPPDGIQTSVAAAGGTADTSTLAVVGSAGFGPGDIVTVGSGVTLETLTVASVSDGQLTLVGKLKFNHGAGELVVRSSGNLQYRDLELPQDVCAAGRVARFGKLSEPSLTSSGDLFATGLSSDGRLTSALHTTKFYGQPLVSWTPALGAEVYQVQVSKKPYPFVPLDKGTMTASTSLVLDVKPGVWYYRVRGFDFSLPTGVQQMSWSDPAKLVVAPPTFKVVGTSKAAVPKKKAAPTAGTKLVSGDGVALRLPSSWQKATLTDSVVTFAYRDPVARDTFHANVNVLRASGRAGRSYSAWGAALADQLRQVVGTAPSTGVVTLNAGKAVRLTATAGAGGKHPISIVQYAVDAGSVAYIVTFECTASSYSSYAATFSTAIASLKIG